MKIVLASVYVVVVLVIGVILYCRQSFHEAETMANQWVVLEDEVEVKARPGGIWTIALEWVDGPALLKLEAGDEEWFYAESDASKCQADGHLSSLVATKNCLLSTAPVGSLIGKIGGSSAGVADGTMFVVGKFCLVEIDKSKGPLYLTINDELAGFDNNREQIKVKISSRPLAVAPGEGQLK